MGTDVCRLLTEHEEIVVCTFALGGFVIRPAICTREHKRKDKKMEVQLSLAEDSVNVP